MYMKCNIIEKYKWWIHFALIKIEIIKVLIFSHYLDIYYKILLTKFKVFSNEIFKK